MSNYIYYAIISKLLISDIMVVFRERVKEKGGICNKKI
jgi:hypothetical protein